MFAPSLPDTSPHPLWWVRATTPSTFGNASSAIPRNWSAIILADDAEQFTEVSTPTKLRVPTRPFARW